MAPSKGKFQLILATILVWPVASGVVAILFFLPQSVPPIEESRLPNGLTLLVLKNAKDRKAAVASFYPAGMAHEPAGKPHLSHVAEHIACFSASGNHAAGESFRRLLGKGAANAETLGDHVRLECLVHPGDVEYVLQVESERLSSLAPTPELLAEEAAKCASEVDFVARHPEAGFLKFGLMGLNQVLRHGADSVAVRGGAEAATVDDARAFVADRYTPSAGIVVVVGDVEPDAVRKAAESSLGTLPAREPAPLPPAALAADVQAMWDLPADAVYLVYFDARETGGPGDDPDRRLALTLFGQHLLQRMQAATALAELADARFSTHLFYPVGDFPFFVFAQAKPGQDTAHLREALETLVEETRAGFDRQALAFAKQGLYDFFERNLFNVRLPPGVTHDQLLSQAAINLGMQKRLRGDLSQEAYLKRVQDLPYEAAERALAEIVAPGNRRAVTFLAADPK